MEIIKIGKLFMLAASLAVVAGCSSTGGSSTGGTDSGTMTGGSGVDSGTVSSTTDGGTGMGGDGSLSMDEKAMVDQKVFLFPFDSSTISTEDYASLDVHAKVLTGNSSQRITIEGHTDERGTREYNLALGERRAKAVKRYLVMKGVAPEQIETVSYGKERPVVEGHAETFWKQNRRAVIVPASAGYGS
ncbi:peptidoglycan-associated lipoprotein Pal [Aestuariirhabdus litorea]|uniref:Peptidoglycan-associated lipoprotein n=1 Tax=Aestuariirhabdus litorea TaxID=2528527 RepID=A0A3P3VRN3_9GAMM|nr:peptidoglycan-associated lipoprotein Pal [Aestuariirhabdus litorea]RRJ84179.1 peptidoglycan-associated lipoprotein Pal [Aestuariirhabdus litorea]RWW97399.1 peptidoglycan-associated lipoprotein Pal [Endozoicomonadaceae bacterium GTF-13]